MPKKRKYDAGDMRQRVTPLIGMARTSRAALARISAALVLAFGVGVVVSEKVIRNAVSAVAMRLQDSIEVPCGNGVDTIPIFSPGKLVKYLSEECPAYNSALCKVARPTPTSQPKTLSMVLYLDEVTSGNVLRVANTRKAWVYYFSFREWSQMGLSQNCFWHTFALLRIFNVKRVTGGVTCVTRMLCKKLQSFAVGITLVLQLSPIMLRALLTNLLADEAALKAAFGTMGATGNKCCFVCMNVLRKAYADFCTAENKLVDVSCYDERLLIASTDEAVWKSCDEVEAAAARWKAKTITKETFNNLETARGIKYIATGLLFDVALRSFINPVSICTYDWFHCWLQSGIACVEFGLFLSIVDSLGLGSSFEQMRQIVSSGWLWPKQQQALGTASYCASLFSSAKAAAFKGAWKADASETLAVYPFLRYFAETVVAHVIPDEHRGALNSFLACCAVLDGFVLAKRGVLPDCDNLAGKHKRHMMFHILHYGRDYLIPKHHLGIHCIRQIWLNNGLLDAFGPERKHQEPKCFGNFQRNNSGYELSILTSCVLEQRRQLDDLTMTNGIVGATVVDIDLARDLGCGTAVCGTTLSLNGAIYTAGDVIVGDETTVLQVAVCVHVDNSRFFLVGAEYCLETAVSRTTRQYRDSMRVAAIEVTVSDKAEPAIAWKNTARGSLLVLQYCR